MAGFDPAFGAFSPGNLLIEDCVCWSISQGLNFDFRITQEAYKLRWSNHRDPHKTFIIACSLRGVPIVLRTTANRMIGNVRQHLGPLLKRYLPSKQASRLDAIREILTFPAEDLTPNSGGHTLTRESVGEQIARDYCDENARDRGIVAEEHSARAPNETAPAARPYSAESIVKPS